MNDAELLRHLDNPGVRIVLTLPIGPALTREWTWREVFEGKAPDWIFKPNPPWWMERDPIDPPETEWHDNCSPITYRGKVRSGEVEPSLGYPRGTTYVDVATSWTFIYVS